MGLAYASGVQRSNSRLERDYVFKAVASSRCQDNNTKDHMGTIQPLCNFDEELIQYVSVRSSGSSLSSHATGSEFSSETVRLCSGHSGLGSAMGHTGPGG